MDKLVQEMGKRISARRKELRLTQVHIPDREPRLHGVLAPPCRKGAPLFHEQF